MTIDPANLSGSPLIERVKNILMKPKEEWERIDGEAAEVRALYVSYVVPLAALSAICTTIGLMLFRWGAGGFYTQLNPLQALISGVFQFGLSLLGIYVMGLIINALAPNFGSQRSEIQAHKVSAYAATAGLLAGVFSLHPWLAIFGLLGLYSLVLLWFGLPKLMKTPDDKKPFYYGSVLALTIVALVIVALVAGAVRAPLLGLTAGMPSLSMAETQPRQSSNEIALPGGGTVDLAELERQAQSYSAGVRVDPARLQEQLPQTLPGGFRLAATSTQQAMGATHAAGEYRNGDARIDVTIVHTGAVGAFAAAAAGANIEQSRQDEDGYARMQTIDGRIYTEEVSNSAGTATYAVVGQGVALTAEGAGVTVDQVRAAVETISIQRLERQFGT